MLGFVTPPDVRRSFTLPPELVDLGESVLGAHGAVCSRDPRTSENSSAPTQPPRLFNRASARYSLSPAQRYPEHVPFRKHVRAAATHERAALLHETAARFWEDARDLERFE